MNVVISGGTGFIGQAITNKLTDQGHKVYILTRKINKKSENQNVTYVEWLGENSIPEENLTDVDAFINLAGESLNSRWTDSKKELILNSRIEATREVVRIIKALDSKPEVLINASAVGYYGTSYHHVFTEDFALSGDDYLSKVVKLWEQEASHVQDEVRVVYTRFGMVLDKKEGGLNKMLLPFNLFVGGRLGTGKQWISWVHIEDVARAVIYSLETRSIQGPVNVTAPEPVIMDEFGKTLAEVIRRPYWAPVPSTVLEMILGEMSILVTQGQKVIPKKLESQEFTFNYPKLHTALKDLLQGSHSHS